MNVSSATERSEGSDTEAESPPAAMSAAMPLYEFGDFQLDPVNRSLSSAGREIALPGRPFDVLLMLVARPGELLTKEELLDNVWAGVAVEESNLTVAISTIRRVLNEDPHDRRFIQTVARRGYRFIAPARAIERPRRSVPHAPAAFQPSSVPEPQAEYFTEPLLPASSTKNTKPFSSMQMFKGMFGAFIALLLAGLGLGCWYLLAMRPPIRTLAVLPFTTATTQSGGSSTGANAREVLLLGMTDGLITRLEADLIVRPTGSVLRYSDMAQVNPVAAGREQGVDAVMTGILSEHDSQRALMLKLIRVRDGLTLWQESFSQPENETAKLEQKAGEAAARELHRLGVTRTGTAAKAASGVEAATNDPAYQLYLRGRYFWNQRTEEGLRKAADSFRQAIDADPNYAPAYAGLADSYALLASFSVEPGSQANADARSAALSAIQLDPTLAAPHASLGMIYFFTDWNLTAAEREFERAIQLNPNYATAHHWYALDLAAMGRFPQALYEIHQAQKLDPLSLIIGTNVGWIEYLSRDNSQATQDLNRVLELDPNFVRALTRRGTVEMAAGDNKAAIADLSRALALSGDEDPWVAGLLGDAEARSGDRAAALRTLEELRRRSQTQYVPPISRALVLIGLGERSAALTALQQSIQDHSTSMVYARVDPVLDPLRSDPAFQKLLVPIQP